MYIPSPHLTHTILPIVNPFFFGDDSDGGVCGNHAAGGNIVAIAADNVLTTP